MTVTDQINILDRNIMQNETQYDLDRKAAKMSSIIEQAKFEYSPLDKIFNKASDKDDLKEGLFKRITNIESKIKSEDKKIRTN